MANFATGATDISCAENLPEFPDCDAEVYHVYRNFPKILRNFKEDNRAEASPIAREQRANRGMSF
jgi:hypothetical protein